MAKPNFYLDTAISAKGTQAVKMLYSFNGQRLKYHTQVNVKAAFFQAKCNSSNASPIKSIAPFGEQHNERLRDIELDAVKIVTATKGDQLTVAYVREQLDLIYKLKPEEPQALPDPVETSFIKYFEQSIQDFKTGKKCMTVGKKKGKRYGERAIKNYGITLSVMNRYLENRGLKGLEFSDVNKEFYADFMSFCYNVEQKEVSTFGSYIKCIKTVMAESGKPFVTKDFYCPDGEADKVYLTTEQIDLIAALDLSDAKMYVEKETISKGIKKISKIFYPTLDKVRDQFLVGAYTGLRLSDLNRLELNNIQKVKNNYYIKIKQQKTGNNVVIPIMSKLTPVLAKYPNVLPSISGQKFNVYIKEIAKLAGLTELRTIKNTKGNIDNETTHPLYALISSHTCRRSYATNMFKAGVPSMLIMSATGHKSEQNFLVYIRATDETKAALLANHLKELGL